MTTATESHPATLASDSAMVSAVRYFEYIAARARSGGLAATPAFKRTMHTRHTPRVDVTPALRQQVVELLHQGCYSQDEIARACGCSQPTVCRIARSL